MKKLKHFWDLDHNNGSVRKMKLKTHGNQKIGWPLIEITKEGRIRAGSGFNTVYGFKTKKEALLFGIQKQKEAIKWSKQQIKKMEKQIK